MDVDNLIAELSRGDEAARAAAGQALLERGPEAVLPLCAFLKEPSRSPRRRALEAIGDHMNPLAVIEHFRTLAERDTQARLKAVALLGRLRDPRAIPSLGLVLTDQDPSLRARAAAVLGVIGDAGAVPALCMALKDSSEAVRISAAVALRWIAEREPAPALRAALPRLHLLSRWSLGLGVYRKAIRAIETATCDTGDLPLPAEAPRGSVDDLPVPARDDMAN